MHCTNRNEVAHHHHHRHNAPDDAEYVARDLAVSPGSIRKSKDLVLDILAAWKQMLVVTAVPRRIPWPQLQHPARLEHLQDRVGHVPRTWPSRKTPEIAEGIQVTSG
jgi:hypothetical protein